MIPAMIVAASTIAVVAIAAAVIVVASWSGTSCPEAADEGVHPAVSCRAPASLAEQNRFAV
jgi:hypothetical protein